MIGVCECVWGGGRNMAGTAANLTPRPTTSNSVFNHDTWDMRNEAAFWACVFVGMAVTQFIGAFFVQYCFGVIAERLACRVRGMSYAKMLEQGEDGKGRGRGVVEDGTAGGGRGALLVAWLPTPAVAARCRQPPTPTLRRRVV